MIAIYAVAIWFLAAFVLGPLVGRLLRRNRRAHTTRTTETPGGSR